MTSTSGLDCVNHDGLRLRDNQLRLQFPRANDTVIEELKMQIDLPVFEHTARLNLRV